MGLVAVWCEFAQTIFLVLLAAGTLEAETPGAVLVAWLHRFFAFITSKQPVGAELLKHSGEVPPSWARAVAA